MRQHLRNIAATAFNHARERTRSPAVRAGAAFVGAGVISSDVIGVESFLSGRRDKVLDHVTGTNQETRESHMRAAGATLRGATVQTAALAGGLTALGVIHPATRSRTTAMMRSVSRHAATARQAVRRGSAKAAEAGQHMGTQHPRASRAWAAAGLAGSTLGLTNVGVERELRSFGEGLGWDKDAKDAVGNLHPVAIAATLAGGAAMIRRGHSPSALALSLGFSEAGIEDSAAKWGDRAVDAVSGTQAEDRRTALNTAGKALGAGGTLGALAVTAGLISPITRAQTLSRLGQLAMGTTKGSMQLFRKVGDSQNRIQQLSPVTAAITAAAAFSEAGIERTGNDLSRGVAGQDIG